MRMTFKAIIFDLDGTLVDSLADYANSVNAVLTSHGVPEHPADAYRYFIGDGIETLVRRAFPPDLIVGAQHGKIVQAVKKEYEQRWADQTTLYEGVSELLDRLEEATLPKAIFTNKPHPFALATVDKFLQRWSFVDVCGIQPGIPHKPDPRGALILAAKMNFKPAEVIYIGDTATDMQTAISGGFYPVGATWGFREAAELQEAGACKLVDHPLEVTTLVNL